MQGSVRKITGKKGVTWSGVIELPRDPVSGARRQKRVSARTRRECEELLRVLVGKLDQPESIEAENLTLDVFAEQTLPQRHRHCVRRPIVATPICCTTTSCRCWDARGCRS